jgi:hypothetical protein
MLWELQFESTVKGLGDESLGDSASVADELADSLVEVFDSVLNLFAFNMILRLNGIVECMPYGFPADQEPIIDRAQNRRTKLSILS